ncbi:MAG: hypothetical protein K0A95_05180 [Chromatiales bacterium]|nr:hypothetical protein [Gammaproteobacteria bacterium]MBW6476448.1 hypothetical protein [Chromatiales bacterium]
MTTRPYADPLAEAELLDPPGGQQLRLRFRGSVQDPDIPWDACIEALPEGQANFYEIGAAGEHGTRLVIGLKAERIELPLVRMAILMIRQYKRLAPGRREFG